jgi:DnaJ family protein A protein 5
MVKFNGRLDYTDAPSGFFGGLNDFFKQLAKEEDIACQWEDLDSIEYPEFGLEDDDYEDVVRPFYAVWNGFATRKSYSWKDQYRLSDAPDRRIRRLMEKENKKLREEASQEYNEAVRSLIAFVRKRDPRVQNNQKSEAERQKALREATAAQAARSRAARQAKLEDINAAAIPEWAKSRPAKDEHEGGFSSESEVEEHEYDCVVCDKTFKSEAQFKAHEKSKKHTKLLKQLQREMRAEGATLELQAERSAPQPEVEPSDEEETLAEPEHTQKPQVVSDDESEPQDEGASDTSAVGPKINGTSKPQEAFDESEATDDDYAPRADVAQRLAAAASADDVPLELGDMSLEGTPITSEPEPEGTAQPKLGKAKQKRAKRAAQKSADQSDEAVSEFQCAVCKADFPSKTKLFAHIKEKNHAALKTEIKGSKGGRGKKR